MFCPRCGANNEENQRFCYNCGNRLETATQPEATPAAQGTFAPPTDMPQPPAYTPPQNTLPQYSPMPTYPPVAQNNGLAIASLVCGILAWVGLLPLVGAIAAVIMGHMARTQIKASNGMQSGNGLAIAGLIMGYIQLALFVVLLCFLVLVLVGVAASGEL
jgi:hypothetical protein